MLHCDIKFTFQIQHLTLNLLVRSYTDAQPTPAH